MNEYKAPPINHAGFVLALRGAQSAERGGEVWYGVTTTVNRVGAAAKKLSPHVNEAWD